MSAHTRNLRVGDIIKSNRTLEVVWVSRWGVTFEDVATSQDSERQRFFYRNHGEEDSWGYEMVRLAAPVKPKVGDVWKGYEIERTPLKRGTVIVGVKAEHTFVLTSAGDWYSPAKYGAKDEEDAYIPELAGEAPYRFVHVA